jgi:hypothetical protein
MLPIPLQILKLKDHFQEVEMKRGCVLIHYPYVAMVVVVVKEAEVEVVVHYVEKFWEIRNEAYEKNTSYLHK